MEQPIIGADLLHLSVDFAHTLAQSRGVEAAIVGGNVGVQHDTSPASHKARLTADKAADRVTVTARSSH